MRSHLSTGYSTPGAHTVHAVYRPDEADTTDSASDVENVSATVVACSGSTNSAVPIAVKGTGADGLAGTGARIGSALVAGLVMLLASVAFLLITRPRPGRPFS